MAALLELQDDRGGAIEALHEAAQSFRGAGLPLRAAWRVAEVGRLHLLGGEEEAADRAFAQIREDCGPDAAGFAELVIGTALARAGEAQPAELHIERGLRRASQEQRRDWLHTIRATTEEWPEVQALPSVAALLADTSREPDGDTGA